jgi:hypothetical protein
MSQEPPAISYASLPPQSADLSHLRTLAICHYVWGGLIIAISSFFLLYVFVGFLMASGTIPLSTAPAATAPSTQFQSAPTPGPAPVSPRFVGFIMAGIGGGVVALGWTLGILTIFSGRALARQRRRTFSMVIAGINCASVPVGTLLGVFTLIVLCRPSVRAMYKSPGAS